MIIGRFADEGDLVKGSEQVCGMTKGQPQHKDIYVEEEVGKRKVCHKAWLKSKLA